MFDRLIKNSIGKNQFIGYLNIAQAARLHVADGDLTGAADDGQQVVDLTVLIGAHVSGPC